MENNIQSNMPDEIILSDEVSNQLESLTKEIDKLKAQQTFLGVLNVLFFITCLVICGIYSLLLPDDVPISSIIYICLIDIIILSAGNIIYRHILKANIQEQCKLATKIKDILQDESKKAHQFEENT